MHSVPVTADAVGTPEMKSDTPSSSQPTGSLSMGVVSIDTRAQSRLPDAASTVGSPGAAATITPSAGAILILFAGPVSNPDNLQHYLRKLNFRPRYIYIYTYIERMT